MSPFLQLVFVIAVILFAAKLGSYISSRLGQPSVLGELLVGLILGPSLIDLTHLTFMTDRHLTEVINELGELGVLILMFMAGLDLHFKELARNTRVSAYAGIFGVIVPVALGGALGMLLGFETSHAVFLGLTLGATSVSISAQTLMELNVLKSRVGIGLLGAAVFDDILVILLLSSFLALGSGGNGFLDVLFVFFRMAGFLSISVLFGIWLLPSLVKKIAKLPISQGSLTFSIVVLLFFGIAAELIGGMAAITGTFLAGLMFARTPQKNDIQAGLRPIAYGFFVPIFFVTIGLGIDMHNIELSTLWLMLLITIVAVVGKVTGAGLGAKIAQFSWRESLQLGIGLISRGEVGLIVAKIGLDFGFLNNNIFSTIVGMVLVTTLVTPPLLRASFEQPKIIKPIPNSTSNATHDQTPKEPSLQNSNESPKGIINLENNKGLLEIPIPEKQETSKEDA